MNNFIEVHMKDGRSMLINIASISYIAPYHRVDDVYKCEIVTVECTSDQHYPVRETYEQVVDKIKRCSSTMVIS